MLVQIAVTALWLAAPVFAADVPFGDAQLQALLANDPATGKPVDSVEELVPLLPRELRSNFTFVYDSRSLFKDLITPKAPRVILFSADARFIVTFIGDAANPGRDLVETMSFDDATATFALHAYVLPAAQRAGWSPPAAAADCASCHGADARPIYDSYPLWPGFYGSVLDTFFHDRLGRAELAKYRAFLAGPAKTGVYSELIFQRGSRTSPYFDPRRMTSAFEVDPRAFAWLPNTRLGMALTELNRARIYRKLAAAPLYAAHEKDILGELLECPGSPRPPPGAYHATLLALRAENAARLKRLGGRPSDPHQSVYGMEELKFVRELTELNDVAVRAGADRSDWSMAMEPNALSYFDGVLSGIERGRSYYEKEDLIFEILEHLGDRNPALKPYFVSYAAYSDQGYPFGNRPDLGVALKACPLLTGARVTRTSAPSAPHGRSGALAKAKDAT